MQAAELSQGGLLLPGVYAGSPEETLRVQGSLRGGPQVGGPQVVLRRAVGDEHTLIDAASVHGMQDLLDGLALSEQAFTGVNVGVQDGHSNILQVDVHQAGVILVEDELLLFRSELAQLDLHDLQAVIAARGVAAEEHFLSAQAVDSLANPVGEGDFAGIHQHIGAALSHAYGGFAGEESAGMRQDDGGIGGLLRQPVDLVGQAHDLIAAMVEHGQAVLTGALGSA